MDDRGKRTDSLDLALYFESSMDDPTRINDDVWTKERARIMEPNTDPTEEEIRAEPLLQLFKHMHLKPELRAISQMYCALAREIAKLPRNPERSVSLRKLRESKDCAVTARLCPVRKGN